METQAPVTTPRRNFLSVLIGASAAGWIASAVYPVLRFLKPLPTIGPGGPVRLSDAEAGKLMSDHFMILRVGAERVLVLEDAQGKVRALSARCTHEGCTVRYSPGESQILCACHNGRFDIDGRVISGPPPRPLPCYAAQRDPDGSVIVNLETA